MFRKKKKEVIPTWKVHSEIFYSKDIDRLVIIVHGYSIEGNAKRSLIIDDVRNKFDDLVDAKTEEGYIVEIARMFWYPQKIPFGYCIMEKR